MRQGNTGTVSVDREPGGATTNAVMDLDGAKVAIGADIHNNTRYFIRRKGEIDDVLIYDRALEPDETQKLADTVNIFAAESIGRS